MMQKFNKIALCAAFLGFSLSTQAQHQPHAGCSVGVLDGAIIKNRMLENRRALAAGEISIQRSPNSITYIPLNITSVANTSGVGHATYDNIFAMVCDLNADYLDQDIQFYIKDSVRFRRNNDMYNNATSLNSTIYMSTNKRDSCLNIYISETVNNQAASFYNPNPAADFIFMMKRMADGSSNTCTHEVGHFFTLPHTFYGWEDRDYHVLYQNQNAPSTIAGQAVERVVRTGSNANCATAADGFCDTEADYISSRWPCPYVGQNGFIARDPLGVTTDPDEDLYMSYFFDACVTTFSPEQKTAITADVASRGWSNLAAPNISGPISAANATAIAPINNQVLFVNGNNSITLQWNPVQNAIGYQIVLERFLLGSSVGIVINTVVYNTTSYTFNSSILPVPSGAVIHDYRWTIRPFNNYQLCNGSSPQFTFKTTSTPVSVDENSAENGLNLTVFPNPNSGNQINLSVLVAKDAFANINLYSAEGKLVLNQRKVALVAGGNNLSFDASELANGVYFIQLQTELGSANQRFVIQR